MILAALGLTFLITDSLIFKQFRAWLTGFAKANKWAKKIDTMINCPQCCGFWAGLLLAIVFCEKYIELPLATSFGGFVIDKLITYIRKA